MQKFSFVLILLVLMQVHASFIVTSLNTTYNSGSEKLCESSISESYSILYSKAVNETVLVFKPTFHYTSFVVSESSATIISKSKVKEEEMVTLHLRGNQTVRFTVSYTGATTIKVDNKVYVFSYTSTIADATKIDQAQLTAVFEDTSTIAVQSKSNGMEQVSNTFSLLVKNATQLSGSILFTSANRQCPTIPDYTGTYIVIACLVAVAIIVIGIFIVMFLVYEYGNKCRTMHVEKNPLTSK